MTAPPASVIIVSRHRAAALMRCLTGLTQQDHPRFEVIVVADPAAAAAVRHLPVKQVSFDEANISAARNLGLSLAAAPVVAFIDDDAVPEPTWLSRLVAPFLDPQVVASTGYVIGRNGISFQWQASEVDSLGQDHPLAITGKTQRANTPQRAVKTQGTNCAFRRDALLSIGGFDPAYRFYLDEADVNLRLAPHGLTAIEPAAQVHHGFAASAHRRADRVPTSLHEIAASTAVFLRRHAPDADLNAEWQRLLSHQSARITAHRHARRITQAEADALLASLQSGWQDGMARILPKLPPLSPATSTFSALPNTGPRGGLVLSGRNWQKSRLLRQASAAVAAGQIVTVICLSPTLRAHRVIFHPKGFWLQQGGLFGRSDRNTPRFRLIRFAARIAAESARLANIRPTQHEPALTALNSKQMHVSAD
jgi:GT2 family glycosyltransferase